MIELNEITATLPGHLLKLIVQQPYERYTPRDHAVWRYVMRRHAHYLPQVAHVSYLEGLKKAGISIDRIPNMYGMNRILSEIGWAAVTVDGFIPPAAFMEFQAHKVLVIAADIRTVEQILYTPAPDIIHEAAGHAPIIADQQYAHYLQEFGITGTKAFSSSYDNRVYESIRHLSILKANPNSSAKEIAEAEEQLSALSALQATPSEMALLRNLHWWTVEYGLIGNLDNARIYGAGLLSSIGESHHCMTASVRKVPYTLAAQHVSFDITKEQPQLFVTPDFAYLTQVLHEFQQSMAWKQGGLDALHKAIDSEAVSTVTYSSGLQVSGRLAKVLEHQGEPAYLSFAGPCMLSIADLPLEGHLPAHHPEGFGSPLGHLVDLPQSLSLCNDSQLADLGIVPGKEADLTFRSGIVVKGMVTYLHRKDGQLVIIGFEQCSVRWGELVLFEPNWGVYDMAVGERIVSACAGATDYHCYTLEYEAPAEKTLAIQYDEVTIALHDLYDEVATMRQHHEADAARLEEILLLLDQKYSQEWLLRLEIFELLNRDPATAGLASGTLLSLQEIGKSDAEKNELISEGLALLQTG